MQLSKQKVIMTNNLLANVNLIIKVINRQMVTNKWTKIAIKTKKK